MTKIAEKSIPKMKFQDLLKIENTTGRNVLFPKGNIEKKIMLINDIISAISRNLTYNCKFFTFYQNNKFLKII